MIHLAPAVCHSFRCLCQPTKMPHAAWSLRDKQRSVPSIFLRLVRYVLSQCPVRRGAACIICLDLPPGCSASAVVAASRRNVVVQAAAVVVHDVAGAVIVATADLVAEVRPRMRSTVTMTSAAAPPNTPFLAT